MIRAAHGVPATIDSIVLDAQSIALAAPTRTLESAANLGDASISPSTIVDRTDPALLNAAVIEFIDATTYMVNGAGAFAYTDGAPITINGSEFSISGAPRAGDQFTLEANFGASGDNRNGSLLADVQSKAIVDGGTVSIMENYAQLVAGVGSATHQVQASLDAQNVVLGNAEEAQLSNSGVNLDEEAANLIRYQQAYQAAARIVSVASTLFDTLLNATRR